MWMLFFNVKNISTWDCHLRPNKPLQFSETLLCVPNTQTWSLLATFNSLHEYIQVSVNSANGIRQCAQISLHVITYIHNYQMLLIFSKHSLSSSSAMFNFVNIVICFEKLITVGPVLDCWMYCKQTLKTSDLFNFGFPAIIYLYTHSDYRHYKIVSE